MSLAMLKGCIVTVGTYNELIAFFHEFCNYESKHFFHKIVFALFLLHVHNATDSHFVCMLKMEFGLKVWLKVIFDIVINTAKNNF